MEVLRKIESYLSFKKDTGEGSFIKSMHIINKISIITFLIAIVILIIKIT